MSGLFGFLLEVVNELGGILLWLLVGAKAWIETENARNCRLAAGGLIVAVIIWLGSVFSSRILNRPIQRKKSLIVALFATLVLTVVLEALRKALA